MLIIIGLYGPASAEWLAVLDVVRQTCLLPARRAECCAGAKTAKTSTSSMKTDPNPLKLIVVGAGSMGRNHARILSALPSVDGPTFRLSTRGMSRLTNSFAVASPTGTATGR